MIPILKDMAKFLRGYRREYGLFQIEVSTYSALECDICPRAVFAEQWTFANMSLETFQKITPHFPRVRWVSFRGWGDPLENQSILTMLRLANEAGCLTSLTTNGALLTEGLSRELMEAGLDELVISLEFATQAALASAEKAGSDLHRILSQVRGIVLERKGANRTRPLVKLSLPMTRLIMGNLPDLVPLAAKLGVDQMALGHLDYLPDERGNILRAFYHESPTPAFQEILAEVRRRASAAGIPVAVHPLKAQEVPVCEPDPPNNVFFSADGSVAPCPYLRIPKKGDIPRIFMNKAYRIPQTAFGNVREEDVREIWQKESYREFRRVFAERRQARNDAIEILDLLSNDRPVPPEKEAPPLADLCRTCYKAYGL
ncbi:MAG: radical SAM/SPASM domain-containing protein [Syntrophales bacterium]